MANMLFIGPKFYNYHEVIKNGFEKVGFCVDYFDDRPDSSFMTKVLVRINRRLIRGKIKKYFNSILNKTNGKKYDVVFVLYGQSFDKNLMKVLKEQHPESRFIFYMYDPISSLPDRKEFVDVFDDCYSFDSDDCKKYGFKLVPLFYSFKNFEKKDIVYDACFISTMMPGKYSKSKEIIRQLSEHGYNVFTHMFIQSKLVYKYFKIKSKDFKKSKIKEFTFKRLSNTEMNNIISQSRYIIDCQKEGQSGLTIRTFEALSAEKKLITTNSNIKEYDFYRPENIYVFDGHIDFDDIFFKKSFVPLSFEVKANYSIDSWVKKILANYKEN